MSFAFIVLLRSKSQPEQDIPRSSGPLDIIVGDPPILFMGLATLICAFLAIRVGMQRLNKRTSTNTRGRQPSVIKICRILLDLPVRRASAVSVMQHLGARNWFPRQTTWFAHPPPYRCFVPLHPLYHLFPAPICLDVCTLLYFSQGQRASRKILGS